MKESKSTMTKRTLTRRIGALTLAFGALALSGCASLAPATPELQVQTRAEQRWQALVGGQWDKAYALVSPSFRATTSAERYRERFAGVPKWNDAKVLKVACEPEKCIATIRIEAQYGDRSGLRTLSTDMPETWLLEDGQWWKYESL